MQYNEKERKDLIVEKLEGEELEYQETRKRDAKKEITEDQTCKLVKYDQEEGVVSVGDVDFNSFSYCKQWKGKEDPNLLHHRYWPFNSLNSWDNVKGKWECENYCLDPSEPVKSQPCMTVFSHDMPISLYNNGGSLNSNIHTPSGDKNEMSDNLEIDIFEDDSELSKDGQEEQEEEKKASMGCK
eukprot:Gb_10371 [translate_table: standard]